MPTSPSWLKASVRTATLARSEDRKSFEENRTAFTTMATPAWRYP